MTFLALVTLWLAGLLGVASAPADQPATPVAARPNVLVVVLDDLGCEKLRPFAMGAPYARAPVIHSLATRGITFTSFYANPLCGPSRAAMLTGRYAFRTGFGPNIFPNYQFALSTNEVCIPEMLRDGFAPDASPYARAAFGKWHLAPYADVTHPNQCGFEHFAGCMSNVYDQSDVHGTFYHHYHWPKVVDGVESVVGAPAGPIGETTWSGSVTMRDASDWILARTGPFFAVVDFNPPHAPYQVPPWSLVSAGTRATIEQLGVEQIGQPYREGDYAWFTDVSHPTHPLTADELARKKRVFFDAMIEATDRCLGQLLERIEPVLGDTMLFVVGDNGTEGGVIDAARYDPNHGKRTCYQLGVRTPLIVAGPLVAAPGRRVDHVVGIVDLWRTVRDVAGAREVPGMIAPDIRVDSVSFLPYLLDPNAERIRRYAFSECFNPVGNPANMTVGSRQRMLTDGRWKLIRSGLDDREELYDLENDPMEEHDLLPGATPSDQAQRDLLAPVLDRLIYSSG